MDDVLPPRLSSDDPNRCNAKGPGSPFVCQLPKGHTTWHADYSVNVNGWPWMWPGEPPAAQPEVIIDGVRYVPAPETPVAKSCRSCGATALECERHVRRHRRGCCAACYTTDTHGMTVADWAAFRKTLIGLPSSLTDEAGS